MVLNMAIKSLLKITELVFFILNGMIDYYLWNYTNLANHPKIIRTTRRYCENSTQPKSNTEFEAAHKTAEEFEIEQKNKDIEF